MKIQTILLKTLTFAFLISSVVSLSFAANVQTKRSEELRKVISEQSQFSVVRQGLITDPHSNEVAYSPGICSLVANDADDAGFCGNGASYCLISNIPYDTDPTHVKMTPYPTLESAVQSLAMRWQAICLY